MKSYLRKILFKLSLSIVSYKVKLAWSKHPLGELENKLIIAPHPDDEILGLGGSILQWIKEGHQLWVVFLTQGEGSGSHANSKRIGEERERLSKLVFQEIGLSKNRIINLKLPDGKVPQEEEEGFEAVVIEILHILEKYQINSLYATHELDYWPYDHIACSQLAKEVIKRNKSSISLYFYWVWAWYHLKPWQVLKIDFSRYLKILIHLELEDKKRLVKMYTTPQSPVGIPWSGELPSILIRGNTQNFELIEKIECNEN